MTAARAARGLAWVVSGWAVLAASCRDEARPPDETALPTTTTAGGAQMVRIPAGWFRMGSARGRANEQPVHRVWVDAFWMDRCEVTQDQLRRLQISDPSHFKGPRRPADRVTLLDAIEFCNERSFAEGLPPAYVVNESAGTWACDFGADGYRLPTEAEWEYACRAGTDAERYFGNDPRGLARHAWFAANAQKRTHPVGRKRPNPWGLYDMYGNVAEWCHDRYDAEYYKASPQRNPRGPAGGKWGAIRGGGWDAKGDRCRSAWRAGEDPRLHDICFAKDTIGFRCVRRAEPTGAGPPASRRSAETATTGLVYSEVYLRHDTGARHPERPARLEAIVRRFKDAGLWDRLVLLPPRAADDRWLKGVHAAAYLDRLRQACRRGDRQMDSPDTPIGPASCDVAVQAAGGVLSAVDAVMTGKVRNAFCAVRPPGHHATKGRAMGFCLLNNVAVAARYAQARHQAKKVLIVDWDVHHGNGTQEAFWSDPTVLYFSVHRHRFYPGTGAAGEVGAGPGKGLTINVPLPAGAGDAEFKKAFVAKLRPVAVAFRPDLVLISAGFDAHTDDPLGGMAVTTAGYADLTGIVKNIAERCCRGRIVSVLEGGYDLGALAASAEAHVRVLMAPAGTGATRPTPRSGRAPPPRD